METRPFLKRLLSPFRKTKSKLEQPSPKTSHTFPLPPPKTQERVTPRRRRRRFYRPSPPSDDPRFNHSLRPSHVARATQKIREGRLTPIDIDRP